MAERERRAQVRVPVQMWVTESSDGVLYFQRSANLSEGGMFLENTIPHPIGTVVQLQLALPDGGKPLDVRAEIVNASAAETANNPLGMGLKFVDLTDDAARRIRAFIDGRGR